MTSTRFPSTKGDELKLKIKWQVDNQWMKVDDKKVSIIDADTIDMVNAENGYGKRFKRVK